MTQIRHEFLKVVTLETIHLQLNHLPQSERYCKDTTSESDMSM